MIKTESDVHNAINKKLNAFRMSGFDNMNMLRAFPRKPNVPKMKDVY